MSNIETEVRSYGGYRELYSRVGRTAVEIVCPFCQARVTAFLWSLCGSGKRCTNKSCRALFDGSGNARKGPARRDVRPPSVTD